MINISNDLTSRNIVASQKLGWEGSTPQPSIGIYICTFVFVLHSGYFLKHLLSPFSSCASCSCPRSEPLFHISQPTHPRIEAFQDIIYLRIGSEIIIVANFLAINPSFLSRLMLRKISLSSKHNLLRLETIDPSLEAEDCSLNPLQLDSIFDQV